MVQTIDKLSDSQNWIAREDQWDNQMVRIPRPEEQVEELRALEEEVRRRIGILNGWYEVWKRNIEGPEVVNEES
ncbi:hypothetical protein ACHAP5_010320 [Fusarium lateritium]